MADGWFSYLQIQICKSFEILENNRFKFSKRDWYKKNIKEGGGTSNLTSSNNNQEVSQITDNNLDDDIPF